MAIKLNGSTSGSVSIDAPADTSPSGTDVTLTLPTSAGSSGQYLQTNGSGTLSWQTVASLSNAEDGTGNNFEFNSGFGSNGVAYGVRAWVNYDSTVAPVNIRGSGNVSSISDGGVGRQTINFTTSMPDANYAVVSSDGDQRTGANSYTQNSAYYDFATGSFKVATYSDTGFDDYANMSFAVIR